MDLTQLQQIVRAQPENADAWAQIADIHVRTERLSEAMAAGNHALAIDPDHAHALLATGIACAGLGELEQADDILTRAVAKRPGDAHAYIHLARVCMRRQMPQRAEALFSRARAINPQLEPAYVGHGNALLFQERFEDAERVFSETARRFPGNAALLNQIGNMYRTATRLDAALKYYRMASALLPGSAEIQNNIANILLAQGLLQEAQSAYRRAVELKPGFWQAHSNLIFLLSYLPNVNRQILYEAHRDWVERQMRGLRKFTAWDTSRVRDRPLRVGYISPDFHHHPVSAFMLPVLANHDSARVITVCFADNLRVDGVTEKLQGLAAEWYSVRNLSDERLVDLIREQRIDILVDLAGHSGNHRLRVFAQKPAPIQISYLGYPATTGLTEMNYRLTDHWADPPGESDTYSAETLLRLPSGFLCYEPDSESPQVAPPPCDARNVITFGSLNNLCKVNEEVISTWGAILNAKPGSRLLMKNHAFSDPCVLEHYLERFEHHGISRDRLDLRSRVTSFADHLATYHEIDIGLDTFPYNGTTTTCEALWMGVPVITLTGCVHAGRVGYSLLSRLQFPELIADDREQYLQIALQIADDREQLRGLRNRLRETVRQSSLCDGTAFARELESLYREIWAKWCGQA